MALVTEAPPMYVLRPDEAEAARQRGLERSARSRRKQSVVEERRCVNCNDVLVPRRGLNRTARFCGKPECQRIRHDGREKALRAAAWERILYQRPRCVVCSKPIVHKPQRRRDARTCGKRLCATTLWRWKNEQ